MPQLKLILELLKKSKIKRKRINQKFEHEHIIYLQRVEQQSNQQMMFKSQQHEHKKRWMHINMHINIESQHLHQKKLQDQMNTYKDDIWQKW